MLLHLPEDVYRMNWKHRVNSSHSDLVHRKSTKKPIVEYGTLFLFYFVSQCHMIHHVEHFPRAKLHDYGAVTFSLPQEKT